MTTRTIDHYLTLTVIDCASCGVAFGVPDRVITARREDGQAFYCPNGHENVYRTTNAQRIAKERDSLRAQLTAEQDQRQAAERSNAALRGEITKQKKRASAGVCPCCQRSFQQLRRHMAAKHPDHATA